MDTVKPKVAVHKFTSCDGCQLAFLNAGESLITLAELVDFVHFAEFGVVNPDAKADIAFVEGSVSTPEQIDQIKNIRQNSKYVITLGACATSGGIQALRNFANEKAWMSAIYASPEYIDTLEISTAISEHIVVNWQLWGCPVNTAAVMAVIRSLLSNATPEISQNPVCLDCKRQGHACVLVTKKQPCMGPVTQTGCGALCPSVGRACYGCYGPSENSNTKALGEYFLKQQILSKPAIADQFLQINNQAKPFLEAGQYFKGVKIVKE